MIENLKQIEDKMLLDLLIQQNKWNTVFINDKKPITERCWIQLGNYRLNLHFIHKCEVSNDLYHSNDCPSAMHILSGKYEMGLALNHCCGHKEMELVRSGNGGTLKYIGIEEGSKHLMYIKEICKLEMNGDNYYEMLDPNGWHYVRPMGDVCATIVLTGKSWETELEKTGKLEPLPPNKKAIMLQWFEEYYRNRVHVQKIIDNEQIKKTDWVKLDENAMSLSDKRGLEKYFNVLGFVIGRDKNFIDVRFGNDRTKIHARNLILMDPSDKPKNVEAAKKKLDDKLDYMNPDNWDDD